MTLSKPINKAVEEFDKKYTRLCDYCGDTEYKDVHNELKSFLTQCIKESYEEGVNDGREQMFREAYDEGFKDGFKEHKLQSLTQEVKKEEK